MSQDVKARMNAGEVIPKSLVKTLIDTEESEKLDWTDACMLAAVFTLSGIHSTTEIILWFLARLVTSLLTMSKNSGEHFTAKCSPLFLLVARVQEELDRVVGKLLDGIISPPLNIFHPFVFNGSMLYFGRLVTSLPAMSNTCGEHVAASPATRSPHLLLFSGRLVTSLLFWHATPHYSTQDYEYNGMFVPKDTVMILHYFTIHHNEACYPNPYTSNPDRYFGDELSCAESTKASHPELRDHSAFGAGRRTRGRGIGIIPCHLWASHVIGAHFHSRIRGNVWPPSSAF
ncbi:cytochrome P450 [Mycena galopus ATCC 62051]|nr:cytochrome P450 [Mycena galopus ATCC 62051]